jgi:hypothetical protein
VVREELVWCVSENPDRTDMLKFRLYGHKLQGSFALIPTRGLGDKNPGY